MRKSDAYSMLNDYTNAIHRQRWAERDMEETNNAFHAGRVSDSQRFRCSQRLIDAKEEVARRCGEIVAVMSETA